MSNVLKFPARPSRWKPFIEGFEDVQVPPELRGYLGDIYVQRERLSEKAGKPDAIVCSPCIDEDGETGRNDPSAA